MAARWGPVRREEEEPEVLEEAGKADDEDEERSDLGITAPRYEKRMDALLGQEVKLTSTSPTTPVWQSTPRALWPLTWQPMARRTSTPTASDLTNAGNVSAARPIALHHQIAAYQTDPRLVCCLAAAQELGVLLTLLKAQVNDSHDGLLQLRTKALLARLCILGGLVQDAVGDEMVSTEDLQRVID